MFAINHAAAALILKKNYEDVPLAWLLVSVQASEMLWVALNLAGFERTTTGDVVHTVHDIHLDYMPFSHSLAGACAVALVFAGLARQFVHRPGAGVAGPDCSRRSWGSTCSTCRFS